MKSSFVLVALLGAVACSCADATRLRARRCFCNRDFNPVCAVLPNDARKTFSNACLANCDGGVVISQGECGQPKYNCDTREVFSPEKAKWCCENEFKGCTPPPTNECFCNRDFNPVCAVLPNDARKTFSNACLANCDGGVVISQGECGQPKYNCDTREVFSPEKAKWCCENESKGCPPPPPTEECFCNRDYNPVCAAVRITDFIVPPETFSNACELNCRLRKTGGVVSGKVYPGKCKTRCTNSFQCPAHSYRKHNRKCYDSFDDCECENGYFKQHGKCVREHDRCTNSFQCPAHSYRKHNRKCYDSFDDCECEKGYFKQHDKCVREHDECTNNFQCPAHSYRKHNRKCYDSFDDCKCEKGYFKQRRRCVHEDFHFGPDDDCRDKGRGDRCDQPDGTKGRCTRNGGRCI